jgi:beta-glucosidase
MFHYKADSSNPRHWAATLDIRGGQVIAIDQNGEPALVAYQNGTGKTLLCAYPLESYLALTPAVFEGQENSYKIYRAFSRWAGVQALFWTDQPMVEVAALADAHRGYAILANHSLKELNVRVSSKLSLLKIRQITPSGFQDLNLSHQGWQMTLGGFSGAIVEWFI